MKTNNFAKNYRYFGNSIEPRYSSKDLWIDILTYSANMTGNWLLSKQVFYVSIVPTAERNPAMFARWVKEMVKKSGVRIKSRAEFLEALNYLRKFDTTTDKAGIKQALYHLFESGLDESAYSYSGLRNSA